MADILAWRTKHPWQSLDQVEQDLIISRALIELCSDDFLSNTLVCRGGTVFHKLFLDSPKRYSEDIDFVQRDVARIGPVFDKVQEILNPLLGKPRRRQGEGVCRLTYRFLSEGPPEAPMKLKIEINTREHFSVLEFEKRRLEVDSRWFNGSCEIQTFALDELLATKVRALYQRRKGRDLFDLWIGLVETECNAETVVQIFKQYMEQSGQHVTREAFENNLRDKLEHPAFLSDLDALLPPDMIYDTRSAFDIICKEIAARI